MAQPKISIITISYNSAKTIAGTIESVVSQGYANREYIIIDGGSKDETMDIVASYGPAIDVVVSEPDKGISDAFNKGIRRATGDLIALINSDDRLMPDALQRVADTWDGESDVWSGNYIARNAKGEQFRITPSLRFTVPPYFQRPVHQGRFITRRLYDRIGLYDEQLHYPMDLDLLIRATAAGAKFQYVDTDVALFTLGGATADSIFRKKKDYIYMIRKNGGSSLEAYVFYAFLVVSQTAKQLTSFLHTDIIRSIRYRK